MQIQLCVCMCMYHVHLRDVFHSFDYCNSHFKDFIYVTISGYFDSLFSLSLCGNFASFSERFVLC